MNQVTKKADLKGATALTRPSVVELLETIARAYEKNSTKTFTALKDVEFHAENVVNVMSTAGTALELAVRVLNTVNVPTPPNVGGVRASLDLTQSQIDDLACRCHGQYPTGATMAERFRKLAASKK